MPHSLYIYISCTSNALTALYIRQCRSVLILVDSATISMAENKEVQYLVCLNSLNVHNTGSGKYTVPAGTKFLLVSSAKGTYYT